MSWLISIIIWSIGLAIAIKLYFKLSLTKWNRSYTCLVGKTVIVTGANTGIGYAAALDFAKRGARVILACRNKDKAENAQRKIINETENPNVIYKLVNLTSLESVRAFAQDINDTEQRIDVLVNNAAGAGLGNHYTSDGLQITMQVNHLSPFLLTHLLLGKIKESAPSRIVNVSSIAAEYSPLKDDNINEFPTNINAMLGDIRMYKNSKLCNILFTTELAKKLDGTGVTTNVLHPGAVKTEIFRRVPAFIKIFVEILGDTYFKSSEEGAQTTIYLAVSEEVKNVTGKLFYNCQQIKMYATARDPHLARIIWDKSEELVKLCTDEKIK